MIELLIAILIGRIIYNYLNHTRLFHAIGISYFWIDFLYEIDTQEIGDLSKIIIVRRCKCHKQIIWSHRDKLKNRFNAVWKGVYLKEVDAAQYKFYLKRKKLMREKPNIYNGYTDDANRI